MAVECRSSGYGVCAFCWQLYNLALSHSCFVIDLFCVSSEQRDFGLDFCNPTLIEMWMLQCHERKENLGLETDYHSSLPWIC